MWTQDEILAARALFPAARDLALRFQGKVPDFVLNLENFPFGMDTQAHLSHLLYIEKQFGPGPLRILDLSCGGGDFTRIARARGHEVLASESDIAPAEMKLENVKCLADFRSYFRKEQRRINGVNPFHLYIHPKSFANLALPGDLDLIYINQCVLHMPSQPGDKFWGEAEWQRFLGLCDGALKPSGLAFILLADPSYLQLGKYLRAFFKHYFLINPKDERYWTTLILDKNSRQFVSNREINSDEKFYEIVGEAVSVMPSLHD